jgi:hypothetical protein
MALFRTVRSVSDGAQLPVCSRITFGGAPQTRLRLDEVFVLGEKREVIRFGVLTDVRGS